jgi:hypothetical protein
MIMSYNFQIKELGSRHQTRVMDVGSIFLRLKSKILDVKNKYFNY